MHHHLATRIGFDGALTHPSSEIKCSTTQQPHGRQSTFPKALTNFYSNFTYSPDGIVANRNVLRDQVGAKEWQEYIWKNGTKQTHAEVKTNTSAHTRYISNLQVTCSAWDFKVFETIVHSPNTITMKHEVKWNIPGHSFIFCQGCKKLELVILYGV